MVMTLKLVIHTLQKTLSRDVKRSNLVLKRKLDSFVNADSSTSSPTVKWAHVVLFYGGVSPSKIGLIAPY
jgi:hypothetical protein